MKKDLLRKTLSSSDTTFRLLVDLNKGKEYSTEDSIIYDLIANVSITKNSYQTYKIQKNSNVYSLLSKLLHIDNRKGASILKGLSKVILYDNKIDDVKSIQPNQVIKLPILPAYSKASTAYVQNLDYINHKVFISGAGESIDGQFQNLNQVMRKSTVGYASINVTKQQLRELIQSYPGSFLESGRIVIGFKPTPVRLHFSRFNRICATIAELHLPTPLLKFSGEYSQIPDSDFGKFVLIDYFNKSAGSHGQEVLSVIKLILKSGGLERIIKKIDTVNVVFQKNESFIISYLKKYYYLDKKVDQNKMSEEQWKGQSVISYLSNPR